MEDILELDYVAAQWSTDTTDGSGLPHLDTTLWLVNQSIGGFDEKTKTHQ